MSPGGSAKPMSVRRVREGDALLERILASVRDLYHRDPDAVRWNLQAGRVDLRALFEADRLAGFLLLADGRDPSFQLGNRIDPEIARRLSEDPRQRIWSVSLLHGEAEAIHSLAELGEAMIESVPADHPGEHLFFVSLSRSSDPRSWRLFRALGFREQGGSAWLGEVDLDGCSTRPARPEGIEIVSMESIDDGLARAFADAYNAIFAGGAPLISTDAVRDLMADSDCDPALSLVAREAPSGEVAGFSLAAQRSGGLAHIACIGLRPAWRARGLIEFGSGVFCALALPRGIRGCTFVTGHAGVLRYAERRFGAREIDRFWRLVRTLGSREESAP